MLIHIPVLSLKNKSTVVWNLNSYHPRIMERHFGSMKCSNSYTTARGAKVGDDLKKLMTLYPYKKAENEIINDSNNYTYKYSNGEFDSISFEVKGGLIKKIHIYSELP